MWKEDGLVIVNPDDLPTVLHPANFSAFKVIETIYGLESQAWGFHLPFQALKDAAEDYYCNDPQLIEKAKVVNRALNAAANPKKEDDNKKPKEPIQ